MMSYKHIMAFFILALFWMSCQNATQGELPDSLAELRELHNQKRQELRDLEQDVKQIEQKIDSLDTGRMEKYPIVTVDTLVKQDFDHFVEVQGKVVSQDNVNATSEIGGNVTSLFVEEGDLVRKGQLLAKINVASQVSNKKEIQKQLELARDIYQRQKRLWEQEIGSEVEYLQAKNRVESLEQSLETIELNIAKSNVHAPKSGVVDEIYIKDGEFAAPGGPVLSIIDHNSLKVKMEVPETYLGKVSKGEAIEVKFPTIDSRQKVKVSRIGSTIDPNNRTFIAEARINAGERGLIRPNMLAVGLINDFHRDTVIQVPIDLVQQEVGGKSFVFVKGMSNEGPVAVKRYVTVGKVANGNAYIKEGLKEGQVILVAGARGLAENERIRIQESSANYPLQQQ